MRNQLSTPPRALLILILSFPIMSAFAGQTIDDSAAIANLKQAKGVFLLYFKEARRW